MDRRSFLGSAAGLAALAPVDLLARDPEAPAEKGAPIPIGFLGAAHSHALGKVKAVLASPEFELVGAFEESEAPRAALEKLGVKLLGREEILRKCRAVAVESEVRHHARDGLIALKAGKHVHLEKPPAATWKEFQEMASLAREGRRILQLGYMWRRNPGLNAALEAARKGWLGDVFSVRAVMNSFVPAENRPEWAEFPGGAMFEQGCHLIDAVVRLLGRPLGVTPFLRRHGAFGDGLSDNTLAVLEFPRALAVVSNSTLQPDAFPHRYLEITGTGGTALLKPIEPPTLILDLQKAAGPYKQGRRTVTFPYERYLGDFKEFSGAIRGLHPPAVTIDEDLLVQETLLRACGIAL